MSNEALYERELRAQLTTLRGLASLFPHAHAATPVPGVVPDPLTIGPESIAVSAGGQLYISTWSTYDGAPLAERQWYAARGLAYQLAHALVAASPAAPEAPASV